jgi:hypothetical protein
MESVLKNLPRAVEPSLDELERLVRDQGLHSVRRALAFEDREQIRVPAIIEVASPRQYLLADRSAHGDLLVFDLSAGRGLCDIPTLAPRWTTQLIEVQRDPEFLYQPARRDAVAPALQFETLDQDLGPLPPGNEILYRFRVRNAGRAPLEIAKAYPDCGCLRVEFPQAALMPGAQGEIVVVFDLRKRKVEGEFEHQIMVESNDPVLPYVRLTVYGNNKQRLSVAPSRVDFGAIPAGMSAHRQAVLTFHADDAIQGAVVEHSISDPRIRVQLRRIQGAEELIDLGLRDVTPRRPNLNRWLFDLQTGPQTATDEHLNAELRLTTNLANYPQVSIPVQGEMVAAVRAFPAKVSVAVGDEANPSNAVLWLVGDPARQFEVVEISSPAATLQFKFQADVSADRHRIEIEAMPENSSTPPTPGEFPCVATLRFADHTTSTVRWSATLVDWAPSN